MKIQTQIEMKASEAVNRSVYTDGESKADGVVIDGTIIEYHNLVQLDLSDGRTFTMDPDAKATVTVTIELDDSEVGEFDANGVVVL